MDRFEVTKGPMGTELRMERRIEPGLGMSPILAVTHDDDLVVVALTGEIDLSNASELETAILEAVPNGAGGLVLDASQLGYLDSSGVRLLLSVAGRLSWRGQGFALASPAGLTVPARAHAGGGGGRVPDRGVGPRRGREAPGRRRRDRAVARSRLRRRSVDLEPHHRAAVPSVSTPHRDARDATSSSPHPPSRFTTRSRVE